MSVDPLDNPQRNAATHRNLINGMRAIYVQPWLEEVTLTEAIGAWHRAQSQKRKPTQLGLVLQENIQR